MVFKRADSFALAVVLLVTATSAKLLAQTASQSLAPELLLDPVPFTSPGRTHFWHRPHQVKWALVFGCGGGGGGGTSGYPISWGSAGRRSIASTIITGLLTSDDYSIEVGQRGPSGSQGGATRFWDNKVTLNFEGGSAGAKGGSQTGAKGEASPFGAGGDQASTLDSAGGSTETPCAGGGAGGVKGGSGGPGYLVIYPLLDLNQVQQKMHYDFADKIDRLLTPELRKQIVEDAVKEATKQILLTLQRQGVINVLVPKE